MATRGYSMTTYRKLLALDNSNPVKRLAFASMALNMHPDELARRLGVSRATIYNWFTGRTAPHPFLEETVRKYADMLHEQAKEAVDSTLDEVLPEVYELVDK